MNIAYIILAHRLPLQLVRLIDRLDGAGTAFFVHFDKSARGPLGRDLQRTFLKALGERANVHLLERHRCYWGGFGIVLATLGGLQAVLASPQRFDRVILMSGQHYPIKTRSHIRQFLQSHPTAEFIESFALRSPNRWTEQRGAYRDLARVLHWHLQLRSRWIHVPIRRRFFAGLSPYGGSQWWCLSLPCAAHIYQYTRTHPDFVSYFRRCFIPDELFFQTIVSNSPFRDGLVGSDLTYAKWDAPAPPYPAVLGRDSLEPLLRSAHLFARKFDQEKDGEILDLIDRRLLEGTTPPPRAASSRLPLAASP